MWFCRVQRGFGAAGRKDARILRAGTHTARRGEQQMQFQLKAILISVIGGDIAMHNQSEQCSIHNFAAIFLQ